MYIDIHTHKDILEEDVFSIKNISIGENINDKDNFSVGIHPWDKNMNEDSFENIRVLAENKNVLMIGESGMDKLKGNFLLQKEYFIKHIKLSEILKKPLIIHCVRAFDELLEIKLKENPTQKWVLHGFSKGKDLAKRLLEAGFYLSFGELLFKNEKTINAFIEIPEDRFFLETDDKTFLIEDIYLRASKLKKISVNKLKVLIENNLNNIR